MNRFFYILLIIILFIFSVSLSFGQERWNQPEPTWNLDPNADNYIRLPQTYNYFNPNPVIRYYQTPIGTMIVSPNFRVLPRSNSHQSEVIICRHPLNPNIMFGSSNAISSGGELWISEGIYVTTDGGVSWFGSDTLSGAPINNHGGDPGPTIDKNGTFIMTHLGYLVPGLFSNFSTDRGLTWSDSYSLDSGFPDKNFAGTDDAPSSPYYGRSYAVWTAFLSFIAVSYTTNSGASWSSSQQINTPPQNHYSQGCDIRVGPNGEVYVIWAAPKSNAANIENFAGFAKSADGGVSWAVTDSIYDMNGIRGNFPSKSGIRVNGFPRIDVDRSGGIRNGWIYTVASEKNIFPAGSDPDVILHRSTNGGINWSSGVRVNQDPLNNGKFQWFPAIRVDEFGGINIVYYDDRNTGSDSGSVFISRSLNGGVTWTDIQVSDHNFKPQPITGGYQGDYIGITSGNGKLWPFWADNFTGIYQAWTADVSIVINPLNTYNLLSPVSGLRFVSLPNSINPITFVWDSSASTASYKWIFGSPTTSPRKLTLPVYGTSLTITAQQMDSLLFRLGLAQGDSITGEWDIWAFKNSLPEDSLKAANGPRGITFKRGIPDLTNFNLNSPPNETSITTSAFNYSLINFNWNRSGQGTTYKWKFGSPDVSNIKLTYSIGFDTSLSLVNYVLDGILGGLGVNPGDSISGQWSVWAYNEIDSHKASQNYSLTLRRQSRGDIIILYDSTSAACRRSVDSVASNLSSLSITYDIYNRKTNLTGTASISFRSYKKVILLGEANSVMSNVVKDSLKSYLISGGNTDSTKSKLVIFSEDIGYHLDRSLSAFADTAFFRTVLGAQYIANRPGATGNNGLIGIAINTDIADSTVGIFPDVLMKSSSVPQTQLYNLYRFRLNPASMNAIGRISPTFNTATMGVDIESLRPAADSPTETSQIRRLLKGALDFVDGRIEVGIHTNNLSIPFKYTLAQNYPNPFNPTTKINFSIPKPGNVSLKIYDVLGKEIMTLINEQKPAGNYEVDFNGIDLASGAYFYRLESIEFVDIKRMILVK